MDIVIAIVVMLAVPFIGLIAGPIIVARLWPERSAWKGNLAGGESGVSAIFWGLPLGLGFFVAVIGALIFISPEGFGSLSTKCVVVSVMLCATAVVLSPLILCGFHRFTWDSEGLEFQGVFRRHLVRWRDMDFVWRFGDGWVFRDGHDGSKLSTGSQITAQPVIVRSFIHYRPDLAPLVTSALQAQGNFRTRSSARDGDGGD